MIGIIILGGPSFELPASLALPKDAFVVCADGGIKKARQWGVRPDVIVGDFDSSTLTDDEANASIVRSYPKEKDLTDGEIAIRAVLEETVSEVIILGKLAGRFDHVLTSVMLMKRIVCKGIPCRVQDENNRVRYVEPGRFSLQRSEFPYFSVLPVDRRLEGVTIEGAKYPLNNVVLDRHETWGISNEWVSDEVTIATKKGDALIIESID